VKAARKKGVQSDRTEITYLEKTMAYGFEPPFVVFALSFVDCSSRSCSVSFEKVKDKDEYTLKLVSLPSRPVTLMLDSKGLLQLCVLPFFQSL
jgi:hypothetical protein